MLYTFGKYKFTLFFSVLYKLEKNIFNTFIFTDFKSFASTHQKIQTIPLQLEEDGESHRAFVSCEKKTLITSLLCLHWPLLVSHKAFHNVV